MTEVKQVMSKDHKTFKRFPSVACLFYSTDDSPLQAFYSKYDKIIAK